MKKLNIGCGKTDFGPSWIHVDMSTSYKHVQFHDPFNIPLPNNSVEFIYSSHMLEYYNREDGLKLLKNWYNLLSTNGVLRLAVPDFFGIASLYYINNMRLGPHNKILSCLDTYIGPLYGKMRVNNDYIYHKTVYDKKSLTDLLIEEVGFVDVAEWDWQKAKDFGYPDDQSRAHVPHSDEAIKSQNFIGRHLISLNLEAIK